MRDWQMIWDASKRPLWDHMCDFGSIVKSFGSNSDLIYLSYQVSTREMRFLMRPQFCTIPSMHVCMWLNILRMFFPLHVLISKILFAD
jgi:hypothetical protein